MFTHTDLNTGEQSGCWPLNFTSVCELSVTLKTQKAPSSIAMWKSAASPTGLTEAEDFFHYTLQHKIHLNGMFEKRIGLLGTIVTFSNIMEDSMRVLSNFFVGV